MKLCRVYSIFVIDNNIFLKILKIGVFMNKQEMIEALCALDAELKSPLKIAITGASALILGSNITRSSNDIDVLRASDRLDQGDLKEAIRKIAIKFNLREDWINSKAEEGTFRDLPGFKPDLKELKTEKEFRFLQPFIISKADSVLTKFARYDNIRRWDTGDIKETQFTEADLREVRKKLDEVSKKDPIRALKIEVEFKGLKREFIKTEDGFSYSNSSEVAHYAKKRYGILLDKAYLGQMDEAIINMHSSYDQEIIKIDLAAIDRIEKEKLKEKDYGMDL